MLNVAVLGCGKIAQVRHIPEYAANENVRLVGFYNPTASRAEDMAKKYGGKVYLSVGRYISLRRNCWLILTWKPFPSVLQIMLMPL